MVIILYMGRGGRGVRGILLGLLCIMIIITIIVSVRQRTATNTTMILLLLLVMIMIIGMDLLLGKTWIICRYIHRCLIQNGGHY